jgi:hypothetical protein
MEKPFFDATEFCNRLTNQGILTDVAKHMVLLQSRYQFCIGILAERAEEDLFDNRSQYHAFKRNHDVGFTMLTYDPAKVEQMFIDELGISTSVAHKFTACEEDYMKELGMM